MRNYYLYALIDPELLIPKYIGITCNPKERFRSHLKDQSITKKTKWLKSLKERDLFPKMKIYKETTNVHTVIKWEIQAIEKCKDKYNLTNTTSGGEYYAIGTPILEFDMDGNFIESFNSMIEYTELKGLNPNCVASISSVCLRKRNYAYGRIFRYLDDSVTEEDLTKLKNALHQRDPQSFIIVDLDGNIISEFKSIQQAELEGFGSRECISQALRGFEGYNSVKDYLVCYDMDDYKVKLEKYLKGKSKGKLDQPINKYDLDGNYIATYYSYADASRSVGAERVHGIKLCCLNQQQQAYGFQWSFVKCDKIEPYKKTYSIKNRVKAVDQYDLEGNFIRRWNSSKEAADFLGKNRPQTINGAANNSKPAYGYIWKYVEAV